MTYLSRQVFQKRLGYFNNFPRLRLIKFNIIRQRYDVNCGLKKRDEIYTIIIIKFGRDNT